jgi:hypothetical protein
MQSLKNITMRVSKNYVDSLTVDQLRYLADFDAQMVCNPSVAGTGLIMEPAIQGPEYKPVYGYIPSHVGLLTDDSYSMENDEYTEAFVEGYGRMPKEHNENLTFVGNPENENKREQNRLAVMTDRDYKIWCNNQVPMHNTPLIVNRGRPTQTTIDRTKLARLGPYRIEYGPDGKKCTVGLNPLSYSTAYCSNCGQLYNMDKDADNTVDKPPEYVLSYEQELHFCSMKCRSEFKDKHHMTPEQMRMATIQNINRDIGTVSPSNHSDYKYRKTNY